MLIEPYYREAYIGINFCSAELDRRYAFIRIYLSGKNRLPPQFFLLGYALIAIIPPSPAGAALREILPTMPEITDCESNRVSPETGSDAATGALPTRQKNALRHLLDRASITPEEVARLDYKTLERAPGVGKQSIEIIRAWLRRHGHELAGQPTTPSRPRVEQRKRKLERAIKYLREHGYEVRHSD